MQGKLKLVCGSGKNLGGWTSAVEDRCIFVCPLEIMFIANMLGLWLHLSSYRYQHSAILEKIDAQIAVVLTAEEEEVIRSKYLLVLAKMRQSVTRSQYKEYQEYAIEVLV